jgi:hypothetical protein
VAFPHACPIVDKYDWLPDGARADGQTWHGGTLTASRGLVLHVTAGNGNPGNWWRSPANKSLASAHFCVMKDGTLIQYVGCDKIAWAEVSGNGQWHSCETEGFPTEPLTDAQVHTLGRLYAWGHATFGWPLQSTDSVSGTGFGWHGMGGASWGGHTGCPGELRKAQRAQILALAAGNPSAATPASPSPATIPVAPPVTGGWESLPTLSYGMRGNAAVASLQRFLNRYDWRPALAILPVTGNFLDMTASVLHQAGKQMGVAGDTDGRNVGPHFKAALWARGWRG